MEKTIGMRIKEQRKKIKMTQEDLSEMMCVPKSTISAYENDKVDIKSSVIIELSEYLKTTPNYLLGFDEDHKSEADEYAESVMVLLKKITNKTIRDLIYKQIKVATEDL